MTQLNRTEWDKYIEQYPQAHILQLGAWGDLKLGFGWDVIRVAGVDSAAQILFRKLPLGLSVAYIPKGPLGNNWEEIWPEIDRVCRKKRAIFLKIEPDVWEDEAPDLQEKMSGFQPSAPIQPQRTLVVSLGDDEKIWLERMKQKTRYNIHLAQRKDVVVREIDDVNRFYELMKLTGQRDKFGVHSLAYYQKAYQLFAERGHTAILEAVYENTPLAALMIFKHGSRAWYFYGASNDIERNRMPTYLLQWVAMQWAANNGCKDYDLWGVPDCPEDELEAQFTNRSDGLWSVYRFKRGFGGVLKRSAGAWDRVYSPLIYRMYRWYAHKIGREV